MALRKKKDKKLSQDLTVVFLRGNGTPRSFRIAMPELHRSLFLLGALLLGSFLITLLALLLYAFQGGKKVPEAGIAESPSPPPATTEQTQTPPADSGSFWNKISSPTASTSDTESAKEIQGLREDIAKLHEQLEARKALPAGQQDTNALLQFLGPRAQAVPESEALVLVKNPKVRRDPSTKELFLDFELHNTDPAQKQVRGYIVAIAKSTNFFYVYPGGAFSPKDNIALQFTKGETFAISRFRQAQASFKNVPENVPLSFQILLFNTQGKVLASMQVDGGR